ncbi:class I SAM-dependent methyltransferase [Microbacterium sp. BR1]|uniref:class I SAM-dependent methyltransferase n=1 Tax=Microbacterium sp. BR1 TaxID=1070896 RepID=UPI000C2B8F83|nr:class I SAM-dependent methyltransferase [Microbacterium sp. BR1]
MSPRPPPAQRPIGQATRGTTGTNRLRRNDRYLAGLPALRRTGDPLVVDLGFGASAVTALELWTRLARVRPDVEVIGVEIDPERVARAREQLVAVRDGTTSFAPEARVAFEVGGFEVPLPDGRRPILVRAMNVLRQYEEEQVTDAWALTSTRLQAAGTLVEGTCDEIGRVCSWIDVDEAGKPMRLTISLRLADLELPSIVAERLPKALIHRNVPGERVHAVLSALDTAWARAAPLGVFSPQQRWIAAVEALRASGVPVLGGRSRWRLGELSLPWAAVAPG